MIAGAKIASVLACLLGAGVIVTGAFADQDEAGQDVTGSRHRADLSLVFHDGLDANSFSGLFEYTYNLGPRSNLGVLVPYLDSKLDEPGGTGVGDVSLTWSWAPFVSVSAAPWIPRRVGSGISLTLPTGNASDLRGLDATILTPFVGLVVPIGATRFSVFPSFTYSHSMGSVSTGEDLRVGTADLGINWLGEAGWWVTVYCTYIKDFESSKTYLNKAISVGRSFGKGWGLSIDLSESEFFLPGENVPGTRSYERDLIVNLHYNF